VNPGEAKPAAGPDTDGPVQAAPAYKVTVDPASAVPLTVGDRFELGESGDTDSPDGAAGGVESLVYETEVAEHADAVAGAWTACA
jgi:hypothetical protein